MKSPLDQNAITRIVMRTRRLLLANVIEKVLNIWPWEYIGNNTLEDGSIVMIISFGGRKQKYTVTISELKEG